MCGARRTSAGITTRAWREVIYTKTLPFPISRPDNYIELFGKRTRLSLHSNVVLASHEEEINMTAVPE